MDLRDPKRCPVCAGQALVRQASKTAAAADDLTYLGIAVGSMLCNNAIPTSHLCMPHHAGMERFLEGVRVGLTTGEPLS